MINLHWLQHSHIENHLDIMKAKKQVYEFGLRNIYTRLPSSVHNREKTTVTKPDRKYLRIDANEAYQ